MTDTIASDFPFSQQEQDLLRELAGLIISPSEEFGVPGADDDQIFADILKSAVPQQNEIKAALAAAAEFDRPLADHVSALQSTPVIAVVVVLVMQCYYRDDRVLVSLGEEARAPYPQGFEVEQGDWSLLEQVQSRGKIWRDA